MQPKEPNFEQMELPELLEKLNKVVQEMKPGQVPYPLLQQMLGAVIHKKNPGVLITLQRVFRGRLARVR